jgi:hypothetical protein
MLYHQPTGTARFSLRRFALDLAASFEAGRRRRRAELDLLSLSPHLKRDLGLLD